jgi:hypothetical protein
VVKAAHSPWEAASPTAHLKWRAAATQGQQLRRVVAEGLGRRRLSGPLTTEDAVYMPYARTRFLQLPRSNSSSGFSCREISHFAPRARSSLSQLSCNKANQQHQPACNRNQQPPASVLVPVPVPAAPCALCSNYRGGGGGANPFSARCAYPHGAKNHGVGWFILCYLFTPLSLSIVSQSTTREVAPQPRRARQLHPLRLAGRLVVRYAVRERANMPPSRSRASPYSGPVRSQKEHRISSSFV